MGASSAAAGSGRSAMHPAPQLAAELAGLGREGAKVGENVMTAQIDLDMPWRLSSRPEVAVTFGEWPRPGCIRVDRCGVHRIRERPPSEYLRPVRRRTF